MILLDPMGLNPPGDDYGIPAIMIPLAGFEYWAGMAGRAVEQAEA